MVIQLELFDNQVNVLLDKAAVELRELGVELQER
jgi:hypothetical protein